jgi:hypothetical protein
VQTIQLTQNQTTIVSDEDFEYLNQFKWYVLKSLTSSGIEKFYAVRNIRNLATGKQILVFMHHEIIRRIISVEEYQSYRDQGLLIDHKNRNRLDNQRPNLRWATSQQNNWNRSFQSNNTDKYKGANRQVSKYKDKIYLSWHSELGYNKQRISLGYFKTALEAALRYDSFARFLYGEFAVLNFPDSYY